MGINIKNKNSVIIFLLLIFFIAGSNLYADTQQISLADLISSPDQYDKRKILFKSEIIGDLLNTKEGSWFNVRSQNYNMGIFLKDQSNIDKITYWGDYKRKGDIVEIKGVFYKNCPISNQRAVHLVDLEVVKQGKELIHPISIEKKKAALIGFVIFLTIGIIYLIKIKLWHKK
jgi:hypothetical protein